jgi:hydrogenase expression/formation protein HypE
MTRAVRWGSGLVDTGPISAMLLPMPDTAGNLGEGKLRPEILARLLQSTARHHPDVLVGAEAGEDAAVVRGAGTLVLTADPITFTEENIGTYTVAVNCNDIVAMGGRPVYLVTTILLPPGTSQRRLHTVFRELEQASRVAGVLWVGGHTEVTSAVTRIVVSAQAVGSLVGRPTRTSDAVPGQLLVMSKWAALEATTLLARDRPEEARRLLGGRAYKGVLAWLHDPGISIIREGEILAGLELGATHDPTEGGVATGIHEIAARSKVGVRVYRDRVPVRPETALLFERFGLDPLGALSSGVFLFTAAPETAGKASDALHSAGIAAGVIGEVTGRKGRVVLVDGGVERPLPLFERDELLRVGRE